MNKDQSEFLLKSALKEITTTNGNAATDAFSSLREVDAKIREVKMILTGMQNIPQTLLQDLENDIDFQANSRRVRLEALSGYIKSALKFIQTGAFDKPKHIIHSPPDFTKLTNSIPGLKEELEKRWREAQKCIHIEAYTSSVILMGSILEGLLLARAQLAVTVSYQSPRAPKDKNGKPIPIQDWSLNTLIDVAVDIGWIKSDRGKFGHALRESRNIVHPWQAVLTRTQFDHATCKTTWLVLESSADDLINSIR